MPTKNIITQSEKMFIIEIHNFLFSIEKSIPTKKIKVIKINIVYFLDAYWEHEYVPFLLNGNPFV